MPFDFKNYGTFTGPSDGNFTFNDEEPIWYEDAPTDVSFNITDIGVLFYQNSGLYAYFHANGNDVTNIILETSAGPLVSLNCDVSQTFFTGDVYIDGNTNVSQNVFVSGRIVAASSVNIAGIGECAPYMQTTRTLAENAAKLASSKKSFDIPHPTKEDYRLRYVCLEGPDAEVYYRGKLKDGNIIELPNYWKNLVDIETIGVTLTPIGCYQELFVEKIEWGSRIIIKNNSSGPINCNYVVYGERKDVSKNIVEYKGLTENDYPGDNDEYTINGR